MPRRIRLIIISEKVAMEIQIRTSGSVTILDLTGNLTIGSNEENLRETVKRLIDEERRHLLLNLSEVPTIDSSGIGAMIKSFTSVNEVNGKLKILKPSRMARQLLSITGLLSILETFEDEASAVSSF
jgi:anti-sigma B factor antagonist